MRIVGLLLLAAGIACAQQQWEVGGIGGLGFLRNVPVTSPAGSATTGFQNGAAAGGFLGYNSSRHLGGEFRYAFLQSNLHISAGGSNATFSGQAHVFHYDLILHTSTRGSKRQLFAALGGGMKVFRGTGTEAAYQPLSQYAYFTKTVVVKPMASVGGGVKYALSDHLILRTEVRDYITAFPTNLIAPAPGAKVRSILQDVVPTVGLSIVF
jgi:hypothetical protein